MKIKGTLICTLTLASLFTHSFGQTTPNPWFSGEVTIVPGTSSSLLPGASSNVPNIVIGNPGASQGVEWSFDAGTGNTIARSTSYINLGNGNWSWKRLHPDPALQATDAWTPMALSAEGTLTVSAPYLEDDVYQASTIVLDPTNSKITINGSPVVVANGGGLAFGTASGAAQDGAAFGLGLFSYGKGQTVLGRYAAYLPMSFTVPPAATDPVLVVGGGASSAARSNALVVRANGDANFSGRLQAGPLADALGPYSTAIGYDADTALAATGGISMGMTTRANGLHSIAMGYASNAYGEDAVAMGNGNNVAGWGAVGMGLNNNTNAKCATAIGAANIAHFETATAIGGWNTANNYASVALGAGNLASGLGSVAFGWQSEASGHNAMAIGGGCKASGTSSLAMGCSWATGHYSSALGFMNRAAGIHEFSVGTYNLPQNPAPTQAGPGDHLFVVGNGSFDGTTENRSNAFVVKRNGDVDAAGVVRVAPGGDIPMFTGN